MTWKTECSSSSGIDRAIIKSDKIRRDWRIYIYHCYGGSHSSVTAAAIHVGLLHPEQKPSWQLLLSLPYFDTQKASDHGKLQFMGTVGDDLVFSVGLQTAAEPAIKALKALFAIGQSEIGPINFIGTMPAVNLWMKIGGICSRVLGLKGIGRPLVLYGTQRAYSNLARLVRDVKG
jgi:hypothetical protein